MSQSNVTDKEALAHVDIQETQLLPCSGSIVLYSLSRWPTDEGQESMSKSPPILKRLSLEVAQLTPT